MFGLFGKPKPPPVKTRIDMAQIAKLALQHTKKGVDLDAAVLLATKTVFPDNWNEILPVINKTIEYRSNQTGIDKHFVLEEFVKNQAWAELTQTHKTPSGQPPPAPQPATKSSKSRKGAETKK